MPRSAWPLPQPGCFIHFSARLGWLGVALTGSDTASNILFGNLQRITSEQLGISAILMSAANSSKRCSSSLKRSAGSTDDQNSQPAHSQRKAEFCNTIAPEADK